MQQTQRSLSNFFTAKFVNQSPCPKCRWMRKYRVYKCYHPEMRGELCGILIHQQWEQNGRPTHLSCKHMEART